MEKMEKKSKKSKKVENEVVEAEIVEAEVVENHLIDKELYIDLKSKYDSISDVTNEIRNLLNNTVQNYLRIGYLLRLISDNDLKELGCESIYEYSKETFNIGETTTKNFINLYKRFAKQINSDYVGAMYRVELKEDFKDYSMSQLVELLPVEDEELNKYKPEMTTKEIRALKKSSQLTDYEKDFYSKVENSFKKIWKEVVSQLKFEFKNKIDDSPIAFSQYGKYEFNIKYKKQNIIISIDADIDEGNYDIKIETQSYDYWYEYKYFRSIDNSLDNFKIVCEIVKFINNDCCSFLDKKIEEIESRKSNKSEESEYDNLLKQVKKDYKDKTFSLEDLKHGVFFDLYEMSKRIDCYLYKHLDFIYNLKIPHALFSSNNFKLINIDGYSLNIYVEVDENIVLRITNRKIDFCLLKDINDYYDHFNLEKCFSEYYSHFSDYKIDVNSQCSLFYLFLEFARLWGAEKCKKNKKANNASDESDLKEEDSKDE